MSCTMLVPRPPKGDYLLKLLEFGNKVCFMLILDYNNIIISLFYIVIHSFMFVSPLS